MLAFLVAMSYIFLNNTTDWVTRGIMISVLVVMTLITAGVLHADWGAMAPSSDSLPKRTKKILIKASKSAWSHIRATSSGMTPGKTKSLIPATSPPSYPPILPIHNITPAQEKVADS